MDVEQLQYEDVGHGGTVANIAWIALGDDVYYGSSHAHISLQLADRVGQSAVFEVINGCWRGRLDFERKVISATIEVKYGPDFEQESPPPEVINELLSYYRAETTEDPSAIISFVGTPHVIWTGGNDFTLTAETTKALVEAFALPFYTKKFAKSEAPKEAKNAWSLSHSNIIQDSDRYMSDSYEVLIMAHENARGYSVSFRIWNAQLGVAGWPAYWHYEKDEKPMAIATFKELENISDSLCDNIQYERPPMSVITPMFRKAVDYIDPGHKEKSGVHLYNFTILDEEYEKDWRQSLYGERYPMRHLDVMNEIWNADDQSRTLEVKGKLPRSQIFKYKYNPSIAIPEKRASLNKLAVQGEWFIDDGGFSHYADGDVGEKNHEIVAAESMMGEDNLEKFHAGTLTDEDIAEIEANEPGFFPFFYSGGDPRDWVVEKHNWIRVNGDNRGTNFQVWVLDADALKRIANFLGEEIWDEESQEYVYITQLKDHRSLEIDATQLLRADDMGSLNNVMLRLGGIFPSRETVDKFVDKAFWYTMGLGSGTLLTAFFMWYGSQTGMTPDQVEQYAKQNPQEVQQAVAQFNENTQNDENLYQPEVMQEPEIVEAPQDRQNLPRGIRNNNPGNIEFGDDWQGMAEAQGDERFITFDSPEYGIRAMARILYNYQNRYGINTLSGIINRWAPPVENNSEAYIAHASQISGFDANQVLDLSDVDTLVPIVRAIIAHENGMGQYYSDEMIRRGVSMAFNNRGGSLTDYVVKTGMCWGSIAKELKSDGFSKKEIEAFNSNFLKARKMAQTALSETV